MEGHTGLGVTWFTVAYSVSSILISHRGRSIQLLVFYFTRVACVSYEHIGVENCTVQLALQIP